MFVNLINKEFSEYITDGKIVCEPEVFRTKLKRILDISAKSKKSGKVSTRKASNFVLFRKSEFHNIKRDHFADFDEWDDWSEDGINEYYNNNSLPVNKLELYIQKQKTKGKDSFKPKLAALVSIQAGLLWKEMTVEEKVSFSTRCDDNGLTKDEAVVTPDNVESSESSELVNDDIQEVALVKDKKKGRPKGKRPINSVSDSAIEASLSNEEEERILEEFEYENEEYFKDQNNKVYSRDGDENFVLVGIYKNSSVIKC